MKNPHKLQFYIFTKKAFILVGWKNFLYTSFVYETSFNFGETHTESSFSTETIECRKERNQKPSKKAKILVRRKQTYGSSQTFGYQYLTLRKPVRKVLHKWPICDLNNGLLQLKSMFSILRS